MGMAFDVNLNTMAIDMHKGDTGSFWVQMELDDGSPFVEGDVAIFEVWQGNDRLMHREFDLQPDEPDDIELGDGQFLIAFRNSDTDRWTTSTKNSEIRVSLNPVRSSGKVVDGDTVRTIVQSTIQILDVKIDI